jgi:hypothetical protein
MLAGVLLLMPSLSPLEDGRIAQIAQVRFARRNPRQWRWREDRSALKVFAARHWWAGEILSIIHHGVSALSDHSLRER